MNWNMQPLLWKRKSPMWQPNWKQLTQQTLLLRYRDSALWATNSAFYSNHIMWGSSVATSLGICKSTFCVIIIAMWTGINWLWSITFALKPRCIWFVLIMSDALHCQLIFKTIPVFQNERDFNNTMTTKKKISIATSQMLHTYKPTFTTI